MTMSDQEFDKVWETSKGVDRALTVAYLTDEADKATGEAALILRYHAEALRCKPLSPTAQESFDNAYEMMMGVLDAPGRE